MLSSHHPFRMRTNQRVRKVTEMKGILEVKEVKERSKDGKNIFISSQVEPRLTEASQLPELAKF